jgi:nucleotidyltransferase-like protein
MVSDELRKLAAELADWAQGAPGYTIFVFGSRVRGDHRTDSDLDIYPWLSGKADNASTRWFTDNEGDNYAAISERLSIRVHRQFHMPGLLAKLRSCPVVHQDRNVTFVLLEPWGS